MIRNNSDALKFNRETLRDKINACWLGKNIGGTIGAPIEGTRGVADLKGFSSESLLANDDLDMQLVWLRAIDEVGIEGISAQVLGDYWLSYVAPYWEEYGVCKRNMKEGFVPPMSGAVNNEWRHSNGAWIRTEIWACLSPGMPEQAAKLAFEDACVDHGMGEGTYAAIFVATLEAAAFVIQDIRKLIQIGLSKIPADCRVAKSVGIVLDGYDGGVDWKETRRRLVQASEDLGWFQAPANVSYAVLGLLYGEGDFKKTILCAVNCGDDTDCSGATAGSILGIAFGTAVIPDDWRKFIGDEIKTIAIVTGHGGWPGSCTELTECIMRILPASTRNRVISMLPGLMPIPESNADHPVLITESPDDFSKMDLKRLTGSRYFEKIGAIAARTRYMLKTSCPFAELWVELDEKPVMAAESTITGRVTIALKRMPEQKSFRLKWYCPEGWRVTGVKNLVTYTKNPMTEWDTPEKQSAEELFDQPFSSAEFTIHSGENVEAANRIVLEASVADRPMPMYLPILILG
jgi:ADP-ribosylglycohydrolase